MIIRERGDHSTTPESQNSILNAKIKSYPLAPANGILSSREEKQKKNDDNDDKRTHWKLEIIPNNITSYRTMKNGYVSARIFGELWIFGKARCMFLSAAGIQLNENIVLLAALFFVIFLV